MSYRNIGICLEKNQFGKHPPKTGITRKGGMVRIGMKAINNN